MTRTAQQRRSNVAPRDDIINDDDFAEAVSDGLDAAIAELENAFQADTAGFAFPARLGPLGFKPDLMMLYLGMVLWRAEKHDQELFRHVRKWYLDVSRQRFADDVEPTTARPSKRR